MEFSMSRKLLNLFLMLSFLGLSIYGDTATAQTHKGISFQGVIKLPSGEYPTRSGMTIKARILAPNGCVLRDEEFSGVNISNGYLNLVIGTGVIGGYDPSLTLPSVMDNSAVKSSLICLNSDGTINGAINSFNPAVTNGARKLQVSLTIDSVPIIADFNMRSVPFAINSETVNGKADTDLINVNNAKSLNQVNVESIFERFTKLDALLNNTNGTGTALGVNISGNAANITGVLAVANGGTGASDGATARTNLGLGPLAILNPTGTADNTTYLRGDGTWATVTSGVTSETDPTVQTFAKNSVGTGLAVSSNQVTVSYGTVAGTAAQGNDSRITGAFQSSTTLSGDLAGTLPSPVVEKIKGQSISAAGATAGQVLRYAGSNTWTPAFVSMMDLRSSVTGNAALTGTGCTAGQTLSWSSVSDSLSCIAISITKLQISDFPTLAASATTDTTSADNITSGTLSVSRLPTSVTDGFWTSSSTNIYRSNGNVGIGTASPTRNLDLQQTDSGTILGISNLDSSASRYPGIEIINHIGSAAAGNPEISFRNRRGNSGASSQTQLNDVLGQVSFIGRGDTGDRFAAKITAFADSNFTNSSSPGSLVFSTVPSASTTTVERMRVSSSGSVGIGTANPDFRLHVAGPTDGNTGVEISGPGSSIGSGAGLEFKYGSGGVSTNRIARILPYTQSGGGGDLLFQTALTATSAYATQMALLRGGNVGVGTAAPSASLVVSKTAPTGTIASTGTAVSGTGTNFTTAFSVGDQIVASGQVKTIATIIDATNLTVNTAFSSDLAASTSYARVGTVLNAGNVGIGTTTPLYSLHVNGDATLGGVIVKNQNDYDSSASASPIISRSTTGGSNTFPFNGAGNLVLAPRADGSNIVFATGATTPQTRMVIAGSGYVGIGTTAPIGALHINNNNGPDTADDFWMTTYSNTATPGMFAVRARGDQTTPTPILNGDTLFTLSMNGYNGSLNRNAATIKVVATNDFNTSPTADMIFYTNSGGAAATEKMRIMASGNVGIGATSPAAKLDVTDTSTTTSAIIVPRAGNFTGTTANGMVRYNTASNLFEFYQNGTWVNYTTVSDGRLKTNVEPVTHGLDIVKQLNPVFYDWDKKNPRTQSFRDKHEVGFIAQEVEKVLPEVVDQGADSYRSVQYGKIVSVVVAAVKELYSKFLGHDEKIKKLETENAALKAYLCGKDPAAAICR